MNAIVPILRPTAGGVAVARVAYLTNVYPKPSHSFIRREILALERQGFAVTRISVRRADGELPDADDQAEAARTHVLLDGNLLALARSVAGIALTRPFRFARTVAAALGMGKRGIGDRLRHLAYAVEACRLVRDLEAEGIDHVHVHFGTNPAAVALLAARLGTLTYSFTVHGPDEFDAPETLSLAAKAEGAAFVAAVSHFGRGQLMRWLDQADWPKINVVRCGVDASFQTEPAPGDDLGLTSTRLVCIARLSAQKGLPLLLDAAARLLADATPFELRIIGGGELRAQLEARIAALGLARHVVLLGTLSAADIRAELRAARALVLPSFAEGLPVVLMEALGLGRPVVATSIAGIPELVDARCGWLVPSGSAALFAEAMTKALGTDPAVLQAMGAVGRARVCADHDADTNAAQLARLIRPLAQRRVSA